MIKIRINNSNNGQIVAHNGIWADTFLTRLRGLLGRTEFLPGEALLIKPCKSVHSIGMRIAIDVAFLSPENEILYIIENMKPYRFSPLIKNALYVVELPAGQIAATGTCVGDKLLLVSSD